MIVRDAPAVTACCSIYVARADLRAPFASSVSYMHSPLNWTKTRLRPCRHVAGTALGAPSAQRRSVRVRYAGGLVLVDLPVDVVVVLEQQERASHT